MHSHQTGRSAIHENGYMVKERRLQWTTLYFTREFLRFFSFGCSLFGSALFFFWGGGALVLWCSSLYADFCTSLSCTDQLFFYFLFFFNESCYSKIKNPYTMVYARILCGPVVEWTCRIWFKKIYLIRPHVASFGAEATCFHALV